MSKPVLPREAAVAGCRARSRADRKGERASAPRPGRRHRPAGRPPASQCGLENPFVHLRAKVKGSFGNGRKLHASLWLLSALAMEMMGQRETGAWLTMGGGAGEPQPAGPLSSPTTTPPGLGLGRLQASWGQGVCGRFRGGERAQGVTVFPPTAFPALLFWEDICGFVASGEQGGGWSGRNCHGPAAQ